MCYYLPGAKLHATDFPHGFGVAFLKISLSAHYFGAKTQEIRAETAGPVILGLSVFLSPQAGPQTPFL